MRTQRVQENAYGAAFTMLEVQACGVLLQAVPGTFALIFCVQMVQAGADRGANVRVKPDCGVEGWTQARVPCRAGAAAA